MSRSVCLRRVLQVFCVLTAIILICSCGSSSPQIDLNEKSTGDGERLLFSFTCVDSQKTISLHIANEKSTDAYLVLRIGSDIEILRKKDLDEKWGDCTFVSYHRWGGFANAALSELKLIINDNNLCYNLVYGNEAIDQLGQDGDEIWQPSAYLYTTTNKGTIVDEYYGDPVSIQGSLMEFENELAYTVRQVEWWNQE